MKRLTDLLADNILSQKSTTQSFQKLVENLQQNGENVVLGNQNSYLEIGQSGINLVSNGRKVTFDQLLSILDFVESAKSESTDGSDQDEGLQDPDDDEVPFPDDEDLLLPDVDEPVPARSPIEGVTLSERRISYSNEEANSQGWYSRNFTELVPSVPWLSLNDGGFVLQPGTYKVTTRTPALNCDYLLSRLIGENGLWLGSFAQTISTPVGANNNEAIGLDSFVYAFFTIETPTYFILQTYVGQGFRFGTLGAAGGVASNNPDINQDIVFAQAMILKFA